MAAKRSKSRLGSSLEEAVDAVGRVLSKAPSGGMLIGGIAVIVRGVPRTTRNVDATVRGTDLDLEVFIEALRTDEIVPRIDDAIEFATRNQVLLLRHEPSGIDVDISLAWLPFELEAIAASEAVVLGSARVPVARPEDLVVYKAVAWRPQDQQDIERLLTLHMAQIDLTRVRRIVGEFAAALDEPERLPAFERLVARVVSTKD